MLRQRELRERDDLSHRSFAAPAPLTRSPTPPVASWPRKLITLVTSARGARGMPASSMVGPQMAETAPVCVRVMLASVDEHATNVAGYYELPTP